MNPFRSSPSCAFLAGAGLGGAIPNAAALAAEFAPRRVRPIAVTLVIVCVPLAAVPGCSGVRLLPQLGWRGLFVIGGLVPVIAAVALQRVLRNRRATWSAIQPVD